MNIDPAYYEHEFKNIKNENQAKFNRAAFFGGIVWMAYRKMYKYAALNFLASLGGSVALATMIIANGISTPNAISALKTVIIAYLIVISVIQGMYANKWYYKTVRQKISSGYHLIDGFRSTSHFGLCLGIWWVLVAYFFEKKELNRYLEKHELSEDDNAFSEQNIKKYLQSAMPQSNELKWGVTLVAFFIAFSWYTYMNTFIMIVYVASIKNNIAPTMEKIANDLNEQAEESTPIENRN